MNKYIGQNVTLLVTDKQYNNMEKHYNNVVGKINTTNLNTSMDSLVKIVNEKFTKMKIGEYKVEIYTENSGYSKSCKWKKNSIICNFIVTFESASKFRIKDFKFNRTTLNGGEYCSDKIYTSDENARKYQIKLLTNYDCCVNLSNVNNLTIRIKNERRIYDDFVRKMYNFVI